MHELYNNNQNEKTVDLTLPLLPEMVRIARLSSSGIASGIGFSIDTVEDIKVVVAEICNRIIIKSDMSETRYIINFHILDKQLDIDFKFEGRKPQDFQLFDKDDIFGVAIVNSLVDTVTVYGADNEKIVTLSIMLKEN